MNIRFIKSTEQFVNQIYDYLENVVGENYYRDYFIEDKKNELSNKLLDEYLFDLVDYLNDCVLDNRNITRDSKDKVNMVDTKSISFKEFNENDYGSYMVSFYYYDSNGDRNYFTLDNIVAEDPIEAVLRAMRKLQSLSDKSERRVHNISVVHFSEDEYDRVAEYIGNKY